MLRPAFFSLLVLPGGILAQELPATPLAPATPVAPVAPETPVAPVSQVVQSTGPWGTIEYYPVSLEPPASHLWEALYNEHSYWNFGSVSRSEARTILVGLGFTEETLTLVDQNGVWTDTKRGLDLDIDDAIVESLREQDRAALAKWSRLNNEPFFSKTVINLEGGDFSAFENGSVSPETLDLVKRMSFRRRNVLSLMDRPYILRQIGNDIAEKERFLRASFATRSLIVRLVLDEHSDIDALLDYWDPNDLNPEVASMFRAVNSTSGVERIDLVQILPAVPRRYLYGFTNLRDVGPHSTPDCFWASVQFFNHQASPRLLDTAGFYHHIDGKFTRVHDTPRYGDIVCMFNAEEGTFVHSYVHIANDIVFTKNGSSFARPFVLTRRSDMLSVYLDETQIREEIYRRKPTP